MGQEKFPIVLFDGSCNLCNSLVNWLLERDRKRVFRFASLQSSAGRRILSGCPPLPDSVVYVDEGGVHTQSTACIRMGRQLGLPWSLAAGFAVIPRPVRDFVYAWVARNRYRWFGRGDQCRLPSAEDRERFLDSEERAG